MIHRSGRGWHRLLTPAVLAVGGAGIASAMWAGGSGRGAVVVGGLYAAMALAAWIWTGRRSEVAAILRSDGDERIRQIDRDATAVTGVILCLAAVVGAVVETALHHGNPGAFGLMCLIGGISYCTALVVLRSRR